MKQPDFWKEDSIYSLILWPISALYILLGKIRNLLIKPYRSKAKVICIGNITIGGAGKTPVAIAIAQVLQSLDKNVAFLSKGYGGKIKEPTIVDKKIHNSSDVGDEPLLLARQALTIIARDRKAGAKLAEEMGADYIIMDDGFQNPSLVKDISLLVFDGTYGIGNGKILPSGPLRESLDSGLSKAKAVIFIGDDETVLKYQLKGAKIIDAKISPRYLNTGEKKYIAFAGIANPSKFFSSLKQAGYNLNSEISFADHHNFTKGEIEGLIKKAELDNCQLITTEKDYVRIASEHKKYIKTFPIEIIWEDLDAIMEIL